MGSKTKEQDLKGCLSSDMKGHCVKLEKIKAFVGADGITPFALGMPHSWACPQTSPGLFHKMGRG